MENPRRSIGCLQGIDDEATLIHPVTKLFPKDVARVLMSAEPLTLSKMLTMLEKFDGLENRPLSNNFSGPRNECTKTHNDNFPGISQCRFSRWILVRHREILVLNTINISDQRKVDKEPNQVQASVHWSVTRKLERQTRELYL